MSKQTLVVLILAASSLGALGANWLDYIPKELTQDNH